MSGFFSLEFTHAFSGQLDCVGRVYDTVEDGVGHGGVSHHVVPVRAGVLRSDDDRFTLVAVLDDVEQYRTLLRIERNQKEVIEDEQLAAFDFLEFGLEIVLDLCHLEQSEQLHQSFGEVVTDYDRLRVRDRDIKKLYKWYNILLADGFTKFVEDTADASDAETPAEDKAE